MNPKCSGGVSWSAFAPHCHRKVFQCPGKRDVPMAKWMTSGSLQVIVRFISDLSGTGSGVDFKTKCVPSQSVESFDWVNRGNLFNATDSCYRCDLRFVNLCLEFHTTKCLARWVRNAQLMRLLSMQPIHVLHFQVDLCTLSKTMRYVNWNQLKVTLTRWRISSMPIQLGKRTY